MENLQVKWESIKRNDVPNMLNETAKAPCSERKTHVTCLDILITATAIYLNLVVLLLVTFV